MKFTKMFTVKANAERFAREVSGTITVMYDWDALKNKMVKLYMVKF